MIRFILALVWIFCSLGALQFDEKLVSREIFFQTFRQDPFVGKALDPVSFEEGLLYAKEIKANYEECLDSLERFKENDLVGDPITRRYKDFGKISPSTLRYLKTAASIQNYFGDLTGFRVLYIGAGYGGVLKILHDLGTKGTYTVLQHNSVNILAEKYLDYFGLSMESFENQLDNVDFSSYDLVIVDAEFSGSFANALVIDKLIQEIPRGFILKRGLPDQFEKWISALIEKGAKGKLQADLLSEDNVRYAFYWKPLSDIPKSKILEKAAIRPSKISQSTPAYTNQVTKNRLGDQLLTYFRAKWQARTTNLPLLLTPFKYADQFSLIDEDPHIGSSFIFNERKEYTRGAESKDLSTLWRILYTPECKYELLNFRWNSEKINVDWDDPAFKELIKASLKPKTDIFTIQPPQGFLSVALHVRTESAMQVDKTSIKQMPIKFYNHEWMVQQLKRLRRLFPEEAIYVYLFTDDLDPANIAAKIQSDWKDPNSVVEWGKNSFLSEQEMLISDFCSFQNFDCLIRPESNFSIMGGKMGNYQCEIFPTSFHFVKKNSFIDHLEIRFGAVRN